MCVNKAGNDELSILKSEDFCIDETFGGQSFLKVIWFYIFYDPFYIAKGINREEATRQCLIDIKACRVDDCSVKSCRGGRHLDETRALAQPKRLHRKGGGDQNVMR